MLRKQYDKLFVAGRDRPYGFTASNLIERKVSTRILVKSGRRKGQIGLADHIYASDITVVFDDGERETFPYQKVEIVDEDGQIVEAVVKDALHRKLEVDDWVGVACQTLIEVGKVKKITPAGLVTVEVKMVGGTKAARTHTVETRRVIKLPVSDMDLMKSVMTDFKESKV